MLTWTFLFLGNLLRFEECCESSTHRDLGRHARQLSRSNALPSPCVGGYSQMMA